VLWGVRIIIPPWGPGENFPKFNCDVSLAEKTGIISAITCPVALTGRATCANTLPPVNSNKHIRLKSSLLSLFIMLILRIISLKMLFNYS
jgi:hypothetical protein